MSYFDLLEKAMIIAEIGVNHNGEIKMAKELIDAAKQSGADAVKFQTYKAERLALMTTPKVAYQKKNASLVESHYEMLRDLQLSEENHFILKDYCVRNNIMFLSTPYDVESAKFLNNEIKVEMFKTASADIVDCRLHNYIASTNKPCIISTGMASLGEIERIMKIYDRHGSRNIILLHCTSSYPCSDQSINIKTISTLKQAFNFPVGYSDHSNGVEASVLAIALGSKVIEKHITLDNKLSGPDHLTSLSPSEFTDLVKAIRRSEIMLGSAVKFRQEEEEEMAKVSRKSIVLSNNVPKEHIIKETDLTLMRPGTGLLPYQEKKLIGLKTRYSMNKGYQIQFKDLT